MNLLYVSIFAASEGKIRTLTIFNRSTPMSVQRTSFNILCSVYGIAAEGSCKHFISFEEVSPRMDKIYHKLLVLSSLPFRTAVRS